MNSRENKSKGTKFMNVQEEIVGVLFRIILIT